MNNPLWAWSNKRECNNSRLPGSRAQQRTPQGRRKNASCTKQTSQQMTLKTWIRSFPVSCTHCHSSTLNYNYIWFYFLELKKFNKKTYKTVKQWHSPGFTELFGVARPILAPSVSEPCVDLSLGESTELGQAHNLTLYKHKYTFIQGSAWANIQDNGKTIQAVWEQNFFQVFVYDMF